MKYLLLLTIYLASCSSIPLPDATISVVNVPLMQLKGYNIKNSYDSNGNRLSTAVPIITPIKSLDDLNKGIWIDDASFANIQGYIKALIDSYNEDK
jgi:hypothetical protein